MNCHIKLKAYEVIENISKTENRSLKLSFQVKLVIIDLICIINVNFFKKQIRFIMALLKQT